MTIPQDEIVQKIKSIWVGSAMIMLGKVQMLLGHNTMSTHWWEVWSEGDERTWIYSHKTWNLTFFCNWSEDISNCSVRLIPQKMREKHVDTLRGLVGNPKTKNPQVFQKLAWGSNQKRRANVERSIRGERMKHIKKNAMQNIEKKS